MKKISKLIIGIGLLVVTLPTVTSCIKDTIPTDIATEEQIKTSSSATEGLLWAMPAYFNSEASDYDYEFGYGSLMHMRDVMTGDMPIISSDYDWYSPWAAITSISQDGSRSWYTWAYYYKFIQTANSVVAAVDTATATDAQLGYLGAAKVFRAMLYLDMAQMYEFLPNDKLSSKNADGNDVTGLTVPIVKENMTEAEVRNNPRAKHDDMAAFILADLKDAIKYIPNLTLAGKTLPHLDAAYGILARYYLWVKDYPDAEAAAANAIKNSSVKPMSQEECLDTKTGFNDISKWMWGSQQTSEDNAVQSGIINWTSWMSNETTFGYAGAGPYVMIDKKMFDRISDTDFRKLEWKAPDSSPLYGKTPWINATAAAGYPNYASAKFRPAQGNTTDYQTGAASAYPIMRVEEMYFIQAEAAAHQDAARGAKLLETFMKKYRDPSYTCEKTSVDDVVEEIVFQKRVELWGEGLTFFDVKRLNYSVTRGYEGTNFYDEARLNTTGRPAWMNVVIYRTEAENNTALTGMNNPDPTKCYTPWTGK